MFKILDATKSKYFSLYLLAIINFFIAYLFLKRPPFIFGDSVSYWNALDFLSKWSCRRRCSIKQAFNNTAYDFFLPGRKFFLGQLLFKHARYKYNFLYFGNLFFL